HTDRTSDTGPRSGRRPPSRGGRVTAGRTAPAALAHRSDAAAATPDVPAPARGCPVARRLRRGPRVSSGRMAGLGVGAYTPSLRLRGHRHGRRVAQTVALA